MPTTAAFENTASRDVDSAREPKRLGYLQPTDARTMNASACFGARRARAARCARASAAGGGKSDGLREPSGAVEVGVNLAHRAGGSATTTR